MTGLKDIFRRKSRGKSISGERPDVSDAPPSPSRTAQSGSSPRNTASTTQNVNNFSARSTTPTQRASRTSAAQDSPALSGQGAPPYETMSSGKAPDRGSYPLHGNGRTNYPNDNAQSPTASRRSVGQPGTALTTNETSAQRSQSRASAYTDSSRYSEDAIVQRRTEEIPPVPQTYQGNPDMNSRQNARYASQPSAAVAGYGSAVNNSNATRDPSHRRDISSASAGSTPKTPIADERNAANASQSAASSAGGSRLDNRNVDSKATSPRIVDQYNTPRQGQQQSSTVMDSSMALGRAVEDNSFQRQTGTAQQQSTSRLKPEHGETSSPGELHRSSIPQRSLDKPLPLPTGTSQPIASSTVDGQGAQRQTLPIRESAQPTQLQTETKPSQTNGYAGATSSSGTRQQPDVVPAKAPDSPSSPRLAGKYMSSSLKPSAPTTVQSGPQQIYDRPFIVEGAASPPSLQGIIDVGNTVDTSTHVRYAREIVHETVLPSVHHIREERVTREIHNYHYHHRILPIVDVLVLPTKHFVRTSDAEDAEYVEVPEEMVPGREHYNWIIMETASKIGGQLAPGTTAPRQFTARTFEGTEGDYKEYINEHGVPTTETWWVHPPTFEPGAYLSGQTIPLHFEHGPGGII